MWNIALRKNLSSKEDGGFSLAEILIAIAVASILMLGIGSLLFSSIRLYGNGNANAEVQNESQRVLNLTLDSIMEAQGVCMSIPAAGDNTRCLMLGDLRIEEVGNSGSFEASFRGTVLAYLPNVDEMLLIDLHNVTSFDEGTLEADGYVKFDLADYTVDSEASTAAGVLSLMIEWLDEIDMDRGAEAAIRLPWTLGQDVTAFRVMPAIGGPDWVFDGPPPWNNVTNTSLPPFCHDVVTYVNGGPEDFYYYAEPLTLRVEISFINDTYNVNNPTRRQIMDDVAVRSRLDVVYVDVNDSSTGMQAYRHWS